MATPYYAPNVRRETKKEDASQAPYVAGVGLTLVFLAGALPWHPMVSFLPLHILEILVSMLMILLVPGTFFVGLVMPSNVSISPLGFFALSLLGSLTVNLSVGYVLSTQHLLYSQPVFIGIGVVSALLVFLTWIIRGQNFRVCSWGKNMFRPAREVSWARVTMMVGALGVFIIAIAVSLHADHTVYPSVYLANRKGQLAGYPVQLQRGKGQFLVLHIDNENGTAGRYSAAEYDNGKLLWRSHRVVERNQVWRHLVTLPAKTLGINHVVIVAQKNGSSTNLTVNYQVQP